MLTHTYNFLPQEDDTLHTITLTIPAGATRETSNALRMQQIALVKEVFGTVYGLNHTVKTSKKGITIVFSGYTGE